MTESDSIYSSEGGSASDQNRTQSASRLVEKSIELRSRKEKKSDGTDGDDKPSNLPPVAAPKKKTPLMTRVISSVVLLGSMTLCYNMGHIYYSLLLIAFGFKCYWELININRHELKDSKNKLINLIEAMPPFMQAFYLLPKTFIRRILVDNDSLINFKKDYPTAYNILFVHHTMVSASFLIVLLLLFTLSLKKG